MREKERGKRERGKRERERGKREREREEREREERKPSVQREAEGFPAIVDKQTFEIERGNLYIDAVINDVPQLPPIPTTVPQ